MSTPSVKSDEIIAAIIAVIKAIVTTGGNYFYSYSTVMDSADESIDEGIVVSEGDEDIIYEESSGTYHDAALEVFIDVIDKNNGEQAARRKAADILKALGQDVTLSGKAHNIRHIRTQANYTDQLGNLISARRIVLTVYYRKLAWSK